MTKFNKEQFNIGKGYKAYTNYCTEMVHGIDANGLPFSYPNYSTQKFVVRFRTAGVGSFVTFLIKNFTVEEYFARLDAGESPLAIAESKGYMLPHIKRWLKEGGYPLTQAGRDQFIKDQMAKADARRLAATQPMILVEV